MQEMNKDERAQFHRLVNQAIRYCIDCRALPTEYCGGVTADVRFGTVQQITFTSVVWNAKRDKNHVSPKEGAEVLK